MGKAIWIYSGSEWVPVGGSRRRVAHIRTGELAPGDEENLSAPLGQLYRLILIETNVPARVRAYVNESDRAADAGREIGTDPSGDHGVIFDFVTTPDRLFWRLSPAVVGYTTNEEIDSVPLRVQNRSEDATAVEVWFTIIGEVG